VNLLLFAVAKERAPSFHWLDIRAPGDLSAELDPARLGWIEEQRLWTVDPPEAFAPDNARANAALFELIREDEPPALLTRLSDFLRLPPSMQRILAEDPGRGKAAVLAVANADRTTDVLSEASLVPILDAVAWAGYSLYVGFQGPPPPLRAHFGSVLWVDGADPRQWEDAAITLERGPSVAGLRAGEPARLLDLPFASTVLRRAVARD
jgi:hypothetical protein